MSYRIHKTNIKPGQLGGTGKFVRVSSNANGVILDEVPVEHLPLVRHREAGLLGWKATVVTEIRPRATDLDYFTVKTRDVVLPITFHDNPDSKYWQDARYVPITSDPRGLEEQA